MQELLSLSVSVRPSPHWPLLEGGSYQEECQGKGGVPTVRKHS